LGRKYGREKQQQQQKQQQKQKQKQKQKQEQATATAIDQSLRPSGFTPAFGRKVWLVGRAMRPEAEASGYRFVLERARATATAKASAAAAATAAATATATAKARTSNNNGNRSVAAPFGLHSGLRQKGVAFGAGCETQG
jgi:hypothetical protein